MANQSGGIKTAPLFFVGGGILLLWSAVSGKKWSTVLKDLISGKSPAKEPVTNPIIGADFGASLGYGYNVSGNLINARQPQSSGTYTNGQLQTLWILAGGSPARAALAACIAEHESAGNPRARNPQPCAIGSNAEGLWQICMPLNQHYVPGGDAFIALANAKAAVTMSQNGENWSPWSTAGDCNAPI